MKKIMDIRITRRLLAILLTAALLASLVPAHAIASQTAAAVETVSFEATSDAEKFNLYQSSAGGFAVADGKLVPAGDAGEFKAIYKDSGKSIRSVSVELHPVSADGPINGGLYINAGNAGDGQDQIDALYIGIESLFTGWEDAPNRIDVIIGSFPTWKEHSRLISETGSNNNLFSGGVKEPITLRADIYGSAVIVTVSLVSDPSKFVTTTYVAADGADLSLGQVGIRSHRNNACYDNFTVEQEAVMADSAVVDFSANDAAEQFALYSTGTGGFALEDGMLAPTGDAGEFKAIYKDSGKSIRSVSVELHPKTPDSPIYGGLYINAGDAADDQDQIDALYIGIESDFPHAGEDYWEDAPNRIDVVIGSFPTWQEHTRLISETGNNNNLFSGGVKEPITLRADIYGNAVTVTVSLVSDPSRCVSTTYVAEESVDLSLGQVGIRSHHNNAMYDDFSVNAAACVEDQYFATVQEAVLVADSSAVKLVRSTEEAITIYEDTAIDLAGYALSNVTVAQGGSLKLIDSATDDYMGAYGSAAVTGQVETFCEVNGRTYMTVGSDGVYSAHRYDAALTHISLEPAKDALGYKAQLYGDEIIQSHVQSFGFHLWVEGGRTKTYEKVGTDTLTLRLKNILANGGGEMNINAAAFVTLAAGENTVTKTCSTQTTTMKTTLQAVDSAWNTYTEAQQTGVKALCEQYLDTVSEWELYNILFPGLDLSDPVDWGEQEYTFAQSQTYCNGQDIEGQWGVGEYTEGGDYGIGDPFVMRYDGKYYMYPSSGTPENGTAGIKVFSSDDLVNWIYEGFAVTGEETNCAYAPEVVYYNGWFYLCQSGSGQGHYIYKSQSPTGPFERITDNFGYNIDGSFWVGDDGQLYFLYPDNNEIWIAPVDMDTMLPGQGTALEGSLDGWTEGPGFFRRGDMLYMTYSGNSVISDDYRVGYSYQLGTDPDGQFVMPENHILLLKTGPGNFRGLGHNANVLGPDMDSWYATYHNLVDVAGPQRRYMLDKLVTNGAEVMANGPTYWAVSVPERPDFETRGTDALIKEGELMLSGESSEAVYTAEYNFSPAEGSTCSMLFGYADENNYSGLTWDDSAKTLTLVRVADGTQTVLDTVSVDFLAADVLHTVRIEQGADRLLVYIDNMRKLDIAYEAGAGQLGVAGDAQWGYLAYSNDAFGTSDFETVKMVEGTFPAVHYLKGERRGFYIANAQVKADGIRQGEKENTVYDESTGSYQLLLEAAGDWVKYAVQVNADGDYSLSALISTASAGARLQIIVDSEEIYELTVPTSEEGEGMADLLLGQLPLTAGNHTLKLRLAEGTVQLQSLTFQEVTE